MIKYFLEKNGNKIVIDPKIVTTEAEKYAQSFFAPGNKIELKATQLRKFYGDAKTLERRFRTSSASGREDDKKAAFAQILPLIKLLKAKSSYANKRKVVPDSFREWMWQNVDQVNSYEDFEAFLLHFEAVVGFSYGYAHEGYN